MHKAKTLVIHCIDLRFQEMINKDVQKNVSFGQFDRISWPGTSIDFENVKNAAAVSLKLHDPDEVIIYEHEDCGAYGENNSQDIHKENAQKLANALLDIKPNLKINLKIAKFEKIETL